MRLYATGLPASVWSFNPRTPCGVRHPTNWRDCPPSQVSIHALLAECDLHYHITLNYVQRFNPRTPCGVRLLALLQVSRLTRFQSTHSLRSATGFAVLHGSCDHSFNPRTPCGVRHGALILNTCQCCFNPRTPCGVRRGPTCLARLFLRFQSTHSLRSATSKAASRLSKDGVSIHALLAECDCAQPYTLLLNKANHTLRQPP